MKHESYDETCSICRSNAADDGTAVFENDLWLIKHTGSPFPLAGWFLLQPQRHVQGPARFNDEEATNFGPALRHFMRTLEVVTEHEKTCPYNKSAAILVCRSQT